MRKTLTSCSEGQGVPDLGLSAFRVVTYKLLLLISIQPVPKQIKSNSDERWVRKKRRKEATWRPVTWSLMVDSQAPSAQTRRDFKVHICQTQLANVCGQCNKQQSNKSFLEVEKIYFGSQFQQNTGSATLGLWWRRASEQEHGIEKPAHSW